MTVSRWRRRGVFVKNPAFDVTPAANITAISLRRA
jgi:methylthioribose-1-phosphate isomerase